MESATALVDEEDQGTWRLAWYPPPYVSAKVFKINNLSPDLVWTWL